MGNFQTLKDQAAIIRDEQQDYKNTALRIGKMFVDMLEQLEDVLPNENVQPDTLTVETTETTYKLKFSTIASDGSVKSREVSLPLASETKAGIMSPALLKGVKDQLTELGDKITQTNDNLFKVGSEGYSQWDHGIKYNKGDVIFAPDGQLMEAYSDIEAGNEYDPGEWAPTSVDEQSKKRDTAINNKASSVGYVECTTLASTAEKTISVNGMSALSTGIRLLVYMSDTNESENVTLNINSLGAKPLYYNNKRASGDNTWDPGAVLDMYFNGKDFHAKDFHDRSVIRLGSLNLLLSYFEDGNWEDFDSNDLFSSIPINGDDIIPQYILDNCIFTCNYLSDSGDELSVIPVNVEWANEQPYYGSPAFYDFSFTYNSTFYLFRLVCDGGTFSGDGDHCYFVKKDISNLIDEAPKDGKNYVRNNGKWVKVPAQEKICYYKTTKNEAVASEDYVASKFPGDILGGTESGDFQIVRFTVAPGKAHQGPSFMLFDGDYKYYAQWDAFGIYPSSNDYLSPGSGFVPKENIAFVKAASTEQVVYVQSKNKFQQISW